MAKTRLEHGLDLWQEIAELQNTILDKEGKLEKNDERIWQGYLHKWDNSDWIIVLEAIGELRKRYPEVFKSYHNDAFKAAASALLKYEDEYDRVLDKKAHKAVAWKMLMTMREVWNQCENIQNPKPTAYKAKNQFHGLFEF